MEAETIAMKEHYWREVIDWSVALLVLSIIFVGLRSVARMSADSHKAWDDLLVLPGLLSLIAQLLCSIGMFRASFVSQHFKDVFGPTCTI